MNFIDSQERNKALQTFEARRNSNRIIGFEAGELKPEMRPSSVGWRERSCIDTVGPAAYSMANIVDDPVSQYLVLGYYYTSGLRRGSHLGMKMSVLTADI